MWLAFRKAVFIVTGRGRRAEGGGTVRRADGGSTGRQRAAAQEGRGWWHKLDVYSIRGVSVVPLGLQLLILFFSLPLPIVSLPSLPVSP